jgi:predicted metal-dependent hydrolase
MSPVLEKKLYFDGIRLFNEGRFFHAHEVWEDAWRGTADLKREFYQGLIQCAVALEHYLRSNPRGVVSLYDSYRRHLRDVPDLFMGLDVKGFLADMHRALRPVVESDPLPPRGAITLDPATAPTITLRYDPFEPGDVERG